MTEIITVPAIITVVYGLIEVLKKLVGNTETLGRFIPLIALVLGAVCGAVCFYFIPSAITADNIVVALVIGAASGLSATGADQVLKQITKKE